MVYTTVYFPEKVIAHINVNWLSPVKVRTTLIGGEKRMLVWNDLEADEKLRVYDKGVQINNNEGVYDLLVHYRSGDMWAPHLDQVEALRQELAYFVECISSGQGCIQRRRRGPARGESAGGRGRIAEQTGGIGLPLGAPGCKVRSAGGPLAIAIHRVASTRSGQEPAT